MHMGNNILAFLVISPLASAAVNIFFLRKNMSNGLLKIVSILQIILCFYISPDDIYNFGSWQLPIGITYKVTSINKVFITLLSYILLLYSFLPRKYAFVDSKSRCIITSLVLFIASSIFGLLLSNDLFHIYVCIEVFSIATTTLLSVGNNHKYAMNYLICSALGATIILYGIGLLLFSQGDLVIRNNANAFACILFLLGCIMKTSLFPMGTYISNVYRGSKDILLAYLMPASSILSFYLIYIFIYRIFPGNSYSNIILSVGFITSVYFGKQANDKNNIRDIVICSAFAQSGYIFMSYVLPCNNDILMLYITLDSIYKFCIFSYFSYENKSIVLTIPIIFIIISVMGIPPMLGFIIKYLQVKALVESKNYIAVLLFVFPIVLSIKYNISLLKKIYSANKNIKWMNSYESKGVHIVLYIAFLSLVLINLVSIYKYLL